MTIASEIQNYANGLGDAYDAVDDMGGVIPQDKNMNNLDTSIRTIPQNLGPTYTAGNGIVISANDEISIDDTVVAELSDLPSDFTGATSLTDGTAGLVPKPLAGDETKFLSGNGQWTTVSQYNLPIASANDLGGIKVGSNLSIDAGTGVLSATVPTVNDATLTITQNGTSAGTFTANSSSDTTIALTDTTYSDFGGATSSVAGSAGLVPAPTTSDPDKFLKGDGTWGTPTDTTYSAGTNVQISAGNVISATDTTYSAFTGATSGAAGTAGLVPAPAAGDQNKVLKGDGTWADDSTELVEMAYGESSAWAKFIAAYNAKKIVYCRASSNANPGSGSQTRKAFMAYVNDATSPTSVEFQYVRSVSSKTSSQPVDQVFVYTLKNTNGGTWSVATRDMAPKLAAGTNTSVSYSSGTYTVNATDTTYSNMTGATSGTAGTAGLAPAPAAGDQDKVLTGAGTWDTRAKITMTSTDPGSGSALSADNYVAVYGNSDGQITSSDLANNAVATANIADGAITKAKLNTADLVNNGEWALIGYAYLATSVEATIAVTVDIPAAYQDQNMQYKVVGAYEIPSAHGGTTTFTQVKSNGVWQSSCRYADRHIFGGAAGDTIANAGDSRIFGHRWSSNGDWDSCDFEFFVSSCYPGSHWTFTGNSGGLSGSTAGTWNGGGRVTDGHAIEAFRLMAASSILWGQGAGFAVYARKKIY